MDTLSYTQEYFLCAVNDKGNPKSLKSDEVTACLLDELNAVYAAIMIVVNAAT